MCRVDKEGSHVVMFSTNLQLSVCDIHSVLTLAGVMLEDVSFFICIERVPDLLVVSKERVLFECSEVALAPSGFLGFIPDEVRFIQGVVILDVLAILLFNFSFFASFPNLFPLHFLALFCHLLSFVLEVLIPGLLPI